MSMCPIWQVEALHIHGEQKLRLGGMPISLPGRTTVTASQKRIEQGKRALIYVENQKEEALDSAKVNSQPFQFMARWVKSAKTNKY